MVKIQVLLSAYNGEKYLREQIDSILYQKGILVNILIRDDGSADRTKVILSEYEELKNICVIYGKNIGVVRSFFELVKNSGDDFDYFAFCDQDDVWLQDKLNRAAEVLLNEKQSEPLLYTSCAEIVDENLVHKSFSRGPRKGVSFYNAMIENVSSGNTQVFNRALKELLCKTEQTDMISMHDHFAYLLASAFGKVIFDEKILIQYRQHDQNAVGMSKSIFREIQEKTDLVFSWKIKRTSRQLTFFSSLYGTRLKQEYQNEIARFLDAGSILKRFKYVCSKKTYYQRPFPALIFWMLYILGFISIHPIEQDV